ncbi:MAG: helix-turn-helix transcriptional regulator [Maribacter sp.]
MFKKVQFYILILFGLQLSAQTAISGFLDVDEISINTEIHLSQIALEDLFDFKKAKNVATASIDENGFFQFKKSFISDKNAIYRLYVNRFEEVLKDTLQVHQLFILSSNDTIHFKKSKTLFGNYVSSNTADKEWQKLRKFEKQLRPIPINEADSLSKGYIGNLKTYAKDSLEILMVKLISVKQLDNKELLDKDIAKNSDYYVSLLSELKESDIERSEYLFLENKLAFLITEVVENKYATSKIFNILLAFVVLCLLFLVFYQRKARKSVVISDLSKQEKNIQGLILQGKSNKEIANELFISLSTVKTHITNIYGKLKVSSRQELLQKMQN